MMRSGCWVESDLTRSQSAGLVPLTTQRVTPAVRISAMMVFVSWNLGSWRWRWASCMERRIKEKGERIKAWLVEEKRDVE